MSRPASAGRSRPSRHPRTLIAERRAHAGAGRCIERRSVAAATPLTEHLPINRLTGWRSSLGDLAGRLDRRARAGCDPIDADLPSAGRPSVGVQRRAARGFELSVDDRRPRRRLRRLATASRPGGPHPAAPPHALGPHGHPARPRREPGGWIEPCWRECVPPAGSDPQAVAESSRGRRRGQRQAFRPPSPPGHRAQGVRFKSGCAAEAMPGVLFPANVCFRSVRCRGGRTGRRPRSLKASPRPGPHGGGGRWFPHRQVHPTPVPVPIPCRASDNAQGNADASRPGMCTRP